MELNEDYDKLAAWAMNMIGNHQLNSAGLTGMMEGLLTIIKDRKLKNEDFQDELLHYGLVSNFLNLRVAEIKLFMKDLERQELMLPEIDMDWLTQKAEERSRIIRQAVIGQDIKSISKTMSKVLAGAEGIDLEED